MLNVVLSFYDCRFGNSGVDVWEGKIKVNQANDASKVGTHEAYKTAKAHRRADKQASNVKMFNWRRCNFSALRGDCNLNSER